MENQTGGIILSQDAFLKVFDVAIEKHTAEMIASSIERMSELAVETRSILIADITRNIRSLEEMGRISSIKDVLEYLDSLTGI